MTRSQKTAVMKVLGIILIALGLLVLINVAPVNLLVAAAILAGILILLGW
jgi:uncharacterized membrane protein HdeD (DUF308 family)